MSRWVIGSLVLMSLGLLIARQARASKRVDLSPEELTLEQLFSGEVPEHVKRTWSSNEEKKR